MTRDAAERITNGEWTEDDFQEVARAYLSLLSNPAARVGELVRPLEWKYTASKERYVAPSPFRAYEVRRFRQDLHCGLDGWYRCYPDGSFVICGTADNGKAACELDYQKRVAQLLKGASNDPA
jgi:hypothetical protein